MATEMEEKESSAVIIDESKWNEEDLRLEKEHFKKIVNAFLYYKYNVYIGVILFTIFSIYKECLLAYKLTEDISVIKSSLQSTKHYYQTIPPMWRIALKQLMSTTSSLKTLLEMQSVFLKIRI